MHGNTATIAHGIKTFFTHAKEEKLNNIFTQYTLANITSVLVSIRLDTARTGDFQKIYAIQAIGNVAISIIPCVNT